MNQLQLPAAELKIIQKENKPYVFDILRKKYIQITPEEWVRQHFVHYLIQYKAFPQSLMANEVLLHFNTMQRRCDTVVYQRNLKPKMIIEYKAPHIKLKQEVFNQISRYNFVLKVDYLLVSNGIDHYCCKMDYLNKSYSFLPEIPAYTDL